MCIFDKSKESTLWLFHYCLICGLFSISYQANNINLIMTMESVRCSAVSNFATPWTVAHKAPLYMGFSRQESWNELPFSSSGDLPHTGIKPRSPALQAYSLPSEPPGKPRREEDGLLFNGHSFNFARWEISRDLLHNSVHYYTLKNGEDGNFWNLFFTTRTEHLIREASLMA